MVIKCMFFYNNLMEERGEGQFVMPIQRFDGVKVNMQIRQKRINCKKRKVKTWTPQQDEQLISLYNQHPKKWALISQLMNDRNQNQCLHRYRRLSQLGAHHKIWSPQEDETVRKLMKKFGRNWKVLSEMVGTKTGKQIRERFINKLDPKIKKEEWSDEEDRKIIELYSELGRKWSQISKHLPGRPQNKIKNRFYSYIQKNYDIKYKVIEEKQAVVQRVGNPQASLRQITSKVQNGSMNEIKEDKFFICNFPSINQMDLELRLDDFPLAQQNRLSKGVIRSMARIEEEWGGSKQRDGFNQNQEGDNDLFYLSAN